MNVPPTYQQAVRYADSKTFDQQFAVSKPKYNDKIFGILFWMTVAAFAVISGFSLNAYRLATPVLGGGINQKNSFTLNSHTMILLAFCIAAAIVLSAIYFTLARMFTKQFIWITGILQIIFGFGTAAFYFYEKRYGTAIVFLIFAVFYLFAFISWRNRIPLATLYLQFTLDVGKAYKSVYLISYLGILVSAAFSAWWSVTLVAAYNKYSPKQTTAGRANPGCGQPGGSCSNTSLILVLVFLTFAAYWITEVIKNVVHVTICGVFGAFYYGVSSPEGVPKRPGLSSFKRAMTYAFGSISFGSLLIALIQLVQQACNALARSEAQGGDIIGAMFACLLSCFVSVLAWILEYFNKYCFVEVALYGKAYLQAAKDTWRLFKQRGIDALINDSLIGNVLNSGVTTVATLTMLLSYLYLRFTKPDYNRDGGYYPVVMAIAFGLGLQIASTATKVIDSGVAALFVCTAENPEILQRHFPTLYNEMVRVYPQVMQGLHA